MCWACVSAPLLVLMFAFPGVIGHLTSPRLDANLSVCPPVQLHTRKHRRCPVGTSSVYLLSNLFICFFGRHYLASASALALALALGLGLALAAALVLALGLGLALALALVFCSSGCGVE